MGFANCSTSLVSMPTVNAQVDEALTAVEGDCQYVLFKVTVPPQVVIESDGDIKFNVVLFSPWQTTVYLILTDATDFSKDAGTTCPSTE